MQSATTKPTQTSVSAIVINYESGSDLTELIESLVHNGYKEDLLEVVVVDNGSLDGSVDQAAARFPDAVVVVPGENLGFAGGANYGATASTGELLLFLNPDVTLPFGAINELVSAFASDRVAV